MNYINQLLLRNNFYYKHWSYEKISEDDYKEYRNNKKQKFENITNLTHVLFNSLQKFKKEHGSNISSQFDIEKINDMTMDQLNQKSSELIKNNIYTQDQLKEFGINLDSSSDLSRYNEIKTKDGITLYQLKSRVDQANGLLRDDFTVNTLTALLPYILMDYDSRINTQLYDDDTLQNTLNEIVKNKTNIKHDYFKLIEILHGNHDKIIEKFIINKIQNIYNDFKYKFFELYKKYKKKYDEESEQKKQPENLDKDFEKEFLNLLNYLLNILYLLKSDIDNYSLKLKNKDKDIPEFIEELNITDLISKINEIIKNPNTQLENTFEAPQKKNILYCYLHFAIKTVKNITEYEKNIQILNDCSVNLDSNKDQGSSSGQGSSSVQASDKGSGAAGEPAAAEGAEEAEAAAGAEGADGHKEATVAAAAVESMNKVTSIGGSALSDKEFYNEILKNIEQNYIDKLLLDNFVIENNDNSDILYESKDQSNQNKKILSYINDMSMNSYVHNLSVKYIKKKQEKQSDNTKINNNISISMYILHVICNLTKFFQIFSYFIKKNKPNKKEILETFFSKNGELLNQFNRILNNHNLSKFYVYQLLLDYDSNELKHDIKYITEIKKMTGGASRFEQAPSYITRSKEDKSFKHYYDDNYEQKIKEPRITTLIDDDLKENNTSIDDNSDDNNQFNLSGTENIKKNLLSIVKKFFNLISQNLFLNIDDKFQYEIKKILNSQGNNFFDTIVNKNPEGYYFTFEKLLKLSFNKTNNDFDFEDPIETLEFDGISNNINKLKIFLGQKNLTKNTISDEIKAELNKINENFINMKVLVLYKKTILKKMITKIKQYYDTINYLKIKKVTYSNNDANADIFNKVYEDFKIIDLLNKLFEQNDSKTEFFKKNFDGDVSNFKMFKEKFNEALTNKNDNNILSIEHICNSLLISYMKDKNMNKFFTEFKIDDFIKMEQYNICKYNIYMLFNEQIKFETFKNSIFFQQFVLEYLAFVISIHTKKSTVICNFDNIEEQEEKNVLKKITSRGACYIPNDVNETKYYFINFESALPPPPPPLPPSSSSSPPLPLLSLTAAVEEPAADEPAAEEHAAEEPAAMSSGAKSLSWLNSKIRGSKSSKKNESVEATQKEADESEGEKVDGEGEKVQTPLLLQLDLKLPKPKKPYDYYVTIKEKEAAAAAAAAVVAAVLHDAVGFIFMETKNTGDKIVTLNKITGSERLKSLKSLPFFDKNTADVFCNLYDKIPNKQNLSPDQRNVIKMYLTGEYLQYKNDDPEIDNMKELTKWWQDNLDNLPSKFANDVNEKIIVTEAASTNIDDQYLNIIHYPDYLLPYLQIWNNHMLNDVFSNSNNYQKLNPKKANKIMTLAEAQEHMNRILIKERGLKLQETTYDGNCQFDTLVKQLEYKKLWINENDETDISKKLTYKQLRTAIVNTLRDNNELVENLDYNTESWNEYLDKMNNNYEWGDYLTLIGASIKYQMKINIIYYQDNKLVDLEIEVPENFRRPIYNPDKREITIGYVLGKHYVGTEKIEAEGEAPEEGDKVGGDRGAAAQ